jgi:Uma2 family endonuclease
MASLRWTSKDLELLPDDGKRYEIIDGQLYISRQPHWYHQLVCARLAVLLETWDWETKVGVANVASGIVSLQREA